VFSRTYTVICFPKKDNDSLHCYRTNKNFKRYAPEEFYDICIEIVKVISPLVNSIETRCFFQKRNTLKDPKKLKKIQWKLFPASLKKDNGINNGEVKN
jgi:hypothetical protein